MKIDRARSRKHDENDIIPKNMTSMAMLPTAKQQPENKEVMASATTDGQGGSSEVLPLLSSLSQYNVEEEVCEIWLDHPGAGVQALLDELILRRSLRRRQLEQACRGGDDDSSSPRVLPAFPAAPTKKRVQQAKALIPYRRIQNETEDSNISNSNNNNHNSIIDTSFDKQDIVHQALERRNKCKAIKQWNEVNRITDGLHAMGIEIDDRYKTWRVTAVASLPVKKEEEITTLPLFNDEGGDASTNTITCEMCGRSFASRNLIFKHLRDVTSGCGTSIWAQGKSVVEPPSVDKKLARQERLRKEKLERNQRRSRAAVLAKSRGDAAAANNGNNNDVHLPTTQQQQQQAALEAGDQIEASLWIGDLPLAWTKPSLVKTKGGSSNYKRLSELLYRYNLPNTPLPWIKSVVRKAYHCKTPPDPPPTAAGNQHRHQQQQQDQRQDLQASHLSGRTKQEQEEQDDGRSDHHHRPYLGYAIVVYRSADEAAAAREHLDGLKVSMESTVFHGNNDSKNIASTTTDKNKKDSSDDLILPSFTLVVRPARKSSTKNNSNSNDSSSCANDNQHGDTTNAKHYALPPAGLDPPLADQLQPLPDDELRLRVLALKRNQRHESTTRSTVKKNDSNHQHDIVDDDDDDNDDNGIVKMLKNMKHDKLVAMAVTEYHLLSRAGQETRPVRRYQGRLIPIPLRDCLLDLLENLLWPAQHQRPMLTSERYLVLVTSTSATPHYKELRDACQKLMQWADPTYYYSGIAVTKNFIASPHIDERDQSFQYAVSLGDFNSSSSGDGGGGGELCVEGKSKSPPRNGTNEEANSKSADDTFVNVVNTHNRIARVDGRRVHWVRTWTGGDRYSLIFYDTTDRNTTPVIEGGVDVDYLQ